MYLFCEISDTSAIYLVAQFSTCNKKKFEGFPLSVLGFFKMGGGGVDFVCFLHVMGK